MNNIVDKFESIFGSTLTAVESTKKDYLKRSAIADGYNSAADREYIYKQIYNDIKDWEQISLNQYQLIYLYDVGAGTATLNDFLKHESKLPDINYCGIEIDPELIEVGSDSGSVFYYNPMDNQNFNDIIKSTSGIVVFISRKNIYNEYKELIHELIVSNPCIIYDYDDNFSNDALSLNQPFVLKIETINGKPLKIFKFI